MTVNPDSQAAPSLPTLVAGALQTYGRLLFLAPSVFLVDQLSKYWVVNHSGFDLGYYPPWGGIELIPDFFALVYAVNEGAAWGILQGHGEWLAALAILALAAIFFFRRDLELHRPPMQWAFGLIIGGIVGNALDRIRYGHVVDFLDVHLGFYRWPTFNFADTGIVCGTLLYLFLSFRTTPSPDSVPPAVS